MDYWLCVSVCLCVSVLSRERHNVQMLRASLSESPVTILLMIDDRCSIIFCKKSLLCTHIIYYMWWKRVQDKFGPLLLIRTAFETIIAKIEKYYIHDVITLNRQACISRNNYLHIINQYNFPETIAHNKRVDPILIMAYMDRMIYTLH